MSLTLHLFKTDVRQTRVLLVVWLLLVLLQCALIGSAVHPGDRLLQGVYLALSTMVPLFQSLTLVVIVPQLVLAAPLVGTTAFWFTRPIERSALLGAKALFAAILIFLPLFAEVAVLAAAGVTSSDILLAVPEILLAQTSLIVVLASVAIFTEGFGRFVIVGAVLIGVSVLVNAGFFSVRLILRPASLMNMGQEMLLMKSRMVMCNLLVVVGGGAVIVHQYLTRRTSRSLTGAFAVAVAMIAVLGFWPWNFFAAPLLPEAAGKFDVAAVKVALSRTMTRDVPSIRGLGLTPKSFEASLETKGLPAGYVAIPRQVHAQITPIDGGPVATQEPAPDYGFGSPNRDVLEYTLGGIPVVNARSPFIPMMSLFTVEAETYGRIADVPMQLTADIGFIASRYVIVSELPLVRGARYDHGSEHAIITDVLRQGEGVDVVVEQRNVQLLFVPTANVFDRGPANFMRNQMETVYLLLNRKRREAVLTKQNVNFDFGNIFSMGAKRLVHQTLRLPFGPEEYNLTPNLNEDWLAGAVLVRLQLVPEAVFSNHFVVEKLKLNSPNRAVRQALPSVPVDPASLAHIVLPENPSKAQVRDYVNSILLASQRRNRFRNDDPQVGMLLKVGAKNLDVIVEAEDRFTGPSKMYLDLVIQRLAGPENKALILQVLAEHHELAEQVVKNGWQAEAHDTLVAGLKDEQQDYLPKPWLQAVASFAEPATYPDLKAYLVRCSNRQAAFNAIRKLPGIDLTATVEEAWTKAKRGTPDELEDASAMAITYGHLDALEALVNILRKSDNELALKRAATLIKRFIPAAGDNAAIVTWFDANREQLVFNASRSRFELRSSLVPSAPVPHN